MDCQSESLLVSKIVTKTEELSIIKYPIEGQIDRIRPSPNDVFLWYQKEWIDLGLSSRSVLACEKSRRIGLTWADASLSIIKAITKGTSTYYSSFNYDSGINYIKDCTHWFYFWLDSFRPKRSPEEYLKGSEKESLLRPVIYFKNGAKIQILPSSAVSIRGRQGDVVLDEAAHRERLEETIESCMSMTIWGNQVRVISTHYGEDNYFNEFCIKVSSGAYPNAGHMKIPFRSAVRMGLYERICQKKQNQLEQIESQNISNNPKALAYHEDAKSKAQWSELGERKWVAAEYQRQGIGAQQELDTIPKSPDVEGGLFSRDVIQYVDPDFIDLRKLVMIRSWDVAATNKPKSSFFTAGCLLGYSRQLRMIFLIDARAKQLDALAGDAFMRRTAGEDGNRVQVIVEREAGSSTIKYESYFKEMMTGFRVRFEKPVGDKYSRAVPSASYLESGELKIVRGDWNAQFVDAICKFEMDKRKKLTSDYVDSLSLGVNFLRPVRNSMLGS